MPISNIAHPNTLLNKCCNLAVLMRLNRPIGLLLLLWPTLWALWIAASGLPSFKLLAIFISGVVLMRSAGCVINDLADRRYDARVTRTRSRPLVTGKVSTRSALCLFTLLSLIAASLLLFLNPLTRWLAVAAIGLAIVYPFMKRYTHLPQLVLGLAFSWGIPMAFAAQTGHVPGIAWQLFLINVCWAMAYDTMYAMVDRADDKLIGVKSTAILWGRWDTRMIALLHVAMLLLLILLGYELSYNAFYYLGLMATAGVMVYLQYLIKRRVPAQCFQAFLMSQWVGFAVWIGLVFALALR
jgi:4-hydroxybenzoate polyprenyltransferase